MPRLRAFASAPPRRARLLTATCLVLWSAGAIAQTPPPLPAPDPLSPALQTNPNQPSRFQKFTRPGQPPLGPPVNYWAPAAGAGVTGFDSTNARRKIKPKASAVNPPPGGDANLTPPAAAANAQAIAPGAATPLAVTRYQTPPPDTSAFANAPGAPPVELGPIRKLPPKLKAHAEPDDPYAPLGVHAGSFTLLPAVELIGGYDSNPGASSSGQAAFLYTVAPELQAQSDWSRHELKADLRGSYTGYSPDETPTLSRPYLNGKIDGRIDVVRGTRVDLGTRLLVSTDSPGSPNIQAGLAKLPIFVTYGVTAGVLQQFNRFELGIKGDYERTQYQDSTFTDGSTASNADRNYRQLAGTLHAGYELMPGVKPYVEASSDSRVHDVSPDVNGFARDSTGVTGRVGSTVDLTRTLTGDMSVGYTRRKYDDSRFDPLSAVIGNASLVWTATPLTTVKLSVASAIGESTVPGVSGVLSRDVGLQVDHALRRWLIASAKFGFGIDDYKGGNDTSTGLAAICDCVITSPGETSPDRQDLRYEIGFGLTYKLSRDVQIKGEVKHNWLHSNVPGNDYIADTFLLGLRLQR